MSELAGGNQRQVGANLSFRNRSGRRIITLAVRGIADAEECHRSFSRLIGCVWHVKPSGREKGSSLVQRHKKRVMKDS